METIKKCMQCGKEHDGSYGSGKFCSNECKQTYVGTKHGEYFCDYCGKMFSTPRALGGHKLHCEKNPNRKAIHEKGIETRRKQRDERDPIQQYTITCSECQKKFTLDLRVSAYETDNFSHFCSSHCAHAYAAHFVDGEKISNSLSTKTHVVRCARCGQPINVAICVRRCFCDKCRLESKNLTGKCEICGKPVTGQRRTCCKEHEKELRIQSFKKTCKIRRSVGGLRLNGCGCGKRGWYEGIHCDSSWELAWVLWAKSQGIKFSRNHQGFEYMFDGKISKYYPDFILENGTYVEIKGWKSPQWNAKVSQFSQPLIVYDREKITPILEFAKKNYGDNFTDVYDQNDLRHKQQEN